MKKIIYISIITLLVLVFIFQVFLRYEYKIVKSGNYLIKIDKLTGKATKNKIINPQNINQNTNEDKEKNKKCKIHTKGLLKGYKECYE